MCNITWLHWWNGRFSPILSVGRHRHDRERERSSIWNGQERNCRSRATRSECSWYCSLSTLRNWTHSIRSQDRDEAKSSWVYPFEQVSVASHHQYTVYKRIKIFERHFLIVHVTKRRERVCVSSRGREWDGLQISMSLHPDRLAAWSLSTWHGCEREVFPRRMTIYTRDNIDVPCRRWTTPRVECTHGWYKCGESLRCDKISSIWFHSLT